MAEEIKQEQITKPEDEELEELAELPEEETEIAEASEAQTAAAEVEEAPVVEEEAKLKRKLLKKGSTRFRCRKHLFVPQKNVLHVRCNCSKSLSLST